MRNRVSDLIDQAGILLRGRFVLTILTMAVLFGRGGAEASDEIVVTAKRNETRTLIDREVFSVNLGDDAASLNTIDVLRRVPGLIIDPTEQVTIRGGEVVGYLIDGKPTRREIAQAIPASEIQSIEVIPNPPADLSSSGQPLVNIILKSSAEFDWTGTASGLGDTNTGFRSGVSLSRGGASTTFRGSVSFRHRPQQRNVNRLINYDTEQESDLLGETFNARATEFQGNESFYQLSTQGNWTKKFPSDFSLTGSAGVSINQLNSDDIETQRVDLDSYISSTSFFEDSEFLGFYPNASLSLEKKYETGREFKATAQAFLGYTELTQDIQSVDPLSFDDETDFFFVQGEVRHQGPLRGKSALLTGATFSVNEAIIQQDLAGFLGPGTGQSSDFEFLRTSLAGFATLQTVWADIDLKAGLRIENLSQDFKESRQNLPGFDGETYVLPSLHLSKALDKNITLQASATVKTEVPDGLRLNPFEKYISLFEVEQGNTFLEPAIVRKVDTTLNHKLFGVDVTQTVFFSDTKDQVSQLTFLGDEGETIRSFTNLGSSSTFGYTVSLRRKFFESKLKLDFDFTFFRRDQSVSGGLGGFDELGFFAATSKLNTEYAFNDKSALAINLGYQGNAQTFGVEEDEIFTSEIKYSRSLPYDASISLTLIDVITPTTRSNSLFGQGFSGSETVDPDTRLVRFGVAKKF